MTALYVGLDRGKDEFTEPTTGTTTTSKDVQIIVSSTANAAGITREEVVVLTQTLENFILTGGLSGAGVGVPVL